MTPEEIDGVNAQFTRSWRVIDVDVDGNDAADDFAKELVMRGDLEECPGR